MFTSFIKQTLRSLSIAKGYFLINLAGLTLGIAAFVIVAFWAVTEISYDKFHNGMGNIYRVNYKLFEEGVLEQHSAAAVPTIGPMLSKTYPEVEAYTRFTRKEGVVKYKEKFYKEKSVFYAESTFFTLFSFPLVSKHDSSDILAVNKAVVTESAAKRYFGNANPVGQVIVFNGNEKYYISAVAKDVPANSHLKFDFLLSYENLINQSDWHHSGWFGPAYYTYVKLASGTDVAALEAKVPTLVEDHLGDFMKEAFFLAAFEFTKLEDIHLYSNLNNELEINGNARQVMFMSFIALMVLLIAFVNYINLSTSRSVERATEVGVKKVMGAMGKHLMGQFMTEALIFTMAATLISLLIVSLILPSFERLMGTPVIVPWSLLPLILLAVFLFSSMFTGLIPALYFSGMSPSLFIRGKGKMKSKGMATLRNSLVVFQFAISLILISGTLIINKQLDFLSNQKLGIDIDQTLVVEGPKAVSTEDQQAAFLSFREEITRIPHVKQMCISTNVPGEEIVDQPVYGKAVQGVNTEKNIRMIGVDQNFFETYGLKLLAGRNFDKSFNSEIKEVILNESALKYLELGSPEEAIDQELTSNLGKARVIGVINDYNQKSLRELPCPMVFSNRAWGNYFSIKVDVASIAPVIAGIEKQWQEKFPGNPLQFFFLDDYFDEQYRADRKFGNLFLMFSILAIFIACLGLLGLSSYNTANRTKEIGIRKVNGATISEILLLLNKDFIRWVAIAFVIACPTTFYIMKRWLGNFAYKTEISWWIFGISGIAAIVIAVLMVSLQSFKAATRNPIEALRYE